MHICPPRRLLVALVMLLSARAGAQSRYHDHVQYVGTIQRRVPDARSAELVLNVWGSTDSTFRGYMTIGAPIGRSGVMHGRYVNGSLEFTSVSTSGDSISWHSSRVGLDLSGEFEIRAGAGVGQSGVWSVKLAHGTALAFRGATPAGSISSLRSDWYWWFLLASVLLAFAFGFRRIWQWGGGAPNHWNFPLTDADARLRGVGGWLVWFLFAQIVSILMGLYRINSVWTSLTGIGWLQGVILPGLRPLIATESLYHIVRIILQAIAVALSTRLDRRARPWWILLFCFTLTYIVADVTRRTIPDGNATGDRGRRGSERRRRYHGDGGEYQSDKRFRLLYLDTVLVSLSPHQAQFRSHA